MSTVEEITRAAAALTAALTADQLRTARGALDDPGLREWTYLPGDRPGLSLEHVDAGQHELVLALLDASHGPEGAVRARGAIEVERVRRRLATGRDDIGGDRYHLRLLGSPDGPPEDRPYAAMPWGWRLNGHHLAVHVVVVGDRFSVTPHFLGSEPADVRVPGLDGARLLGLEEQLGRDLAVSLDPDQAATGIPLERAPDDVLTRADPVADPTVLPDGIAHDDLRPDQQDVLGRLVRLYLARAPREYADRCWEETVAAGLHRVRFAWAGGLRPGQGHYYCVRAPEYLIEFDNTQDDANHAHSVWRHLRDDWGQDLLRAHYGDRHRLTQDEGR